MSQKGGLLADLDPVPAAEPLGDGIALGALGHHDPHEIEAVGWFSRF
jgi:hypothetical protein